MIHNSTQALARMESFDGVIGLPNAFESMSDEMIDLQFSRHALVHKHGNIPAGLETTKCGP